MERRFEVRKEAMLAECAVSPQVFTGVMERLAKFVEPFAQYLGQPAQREHALEYLNGLMSDLERKNVESIAYRHEQDRRGLQHFMGCMVRAALAHRPAAGRRLVRLDPRAPRDRRLALSAHSELSHVEPVDAPLVDELFRLSRLGGDLRHGG